MAIQTESLNGAIRETPISAMTYLNMQCFNPLYFCRL